MSRSGGKEGYAEGFLVHYLVAMVYPSGLTRELQVAFGVFALRSIWRSTRFSCEGPSDPPLGSRGFPLLQMRVWRRRLAVL